MPKMTDFMLLDAATRRAVGGMSYAGSVDRQKWEKARDMAGITKGQWKRFIYSMKKKAPACIELRISEVSMAKLKLMAEHGESPHLETLLKVVEIQMEGPDEHG